MTDIYSTANGNGRYTLRQFVGHALAVISPQRTKELRESPIASPEGICDRAIMSHLKYKAVKEGRSDFLELLHKDFWKGEGGRVFSTNCDHRFEELFLKRQKEDFEVLVNAWEKSDLQRLVEFGCNSGLLLNYLTQQLPGVKAAIGLEINEDQVETNQKADSFDQRIRFVCADAGQWLLQNGEANSLFVSNGGVLEYFPRVRLDEMLSHIADNLAPSLFFAIEPVACDHDWSSEVESIPFGEELSFSHNYKDLFESNGFELLHQRATDFESWRMVATIARVDRQG